MKAADRALQNVLCFWGTICLHVLEHALMQKTILQEQHSELRTPFFMLMIRWPKDLLFHVWGQRFCYDVPLSVRKSSGPRHHHHPTQCCSACPKNVLPALGNLPSASPVRGMLSSVLQLSGTSVAFNIPEWIARYHTTRASSTVAWVIQDGKTVNG